MTCTVTSREEAEETRLALYALSRAFGSLKPVLYGGRRAQRAELMYRMKAVRPWEWDQVCKTRQSREVQKSVKMRKAALELLEEAREALKTEGRTLEVQEDFRVVRRELAKPVPHISRSSYSGQMESQSHAQVLADLKALPIPCSAPVAGQTDSASAATRYKTYKRVQNMRKRVRRAIRAGGGQAA